jgi:hypothetical protein
MSKIKGLVLFCICALLPGIMLGQADKPGPLAGKWKLNVAKSNFGGGPKLQAMVMDVTSDTPSSIVYSVTETAESGMTFTLKFKGAADAKEYPIEGGSTLYSYTEENGVVNETQKDTDGTITKGTFVVAPNGKSGVWTYEITDPQGGVIHTRMVFDRVQ